MSTRVQKTQNMDRKGLSLYVEKVAELPFTALRPSLRSHMYSLLQRTGAHRICKVVEGFFMKIADGGLERSALTRGSNIYVYISV